MAQPRAASETDAANGALALVGQAPIVDLGQGTPAAIVAKQRFGDVRDALLREKEWNFASRWTTPAASTQAALGPLKIRYPMPADCLAVIGIEGCEPDQWVLEAAQVTVTDAMPTLAMVLVTNVVAPLVNYTARIVEPFLWDALFLRVFQRRLGAEIARIIPKDSGLADKLDAQARRELDTASMRDSREVASTHIPQTSSWVDSRFSTGRRFFR